MARLKTNSWTQMSRLSHGHNAHIFLMPLVLRTDIDQSNGLQVINDGVLPE